LRAHYPYSQLEGHLQNIFATENCMRIIRAIIISSVVALHADVSHFWTRDLLILKKKRRIEHCKSYIEVICRMHGVEITKVKKIKSQ